MGFSSEVTALGFSGAVSGILIWPPFQCPAVRRAVSRGPAFPSGGEADLPSPIPFPPWARFFLALLRICWVGLVGERCRLKGTLPPPTKCCILLWPPGCTGMTGVKNTSWGWEGSLTFFKPNHTDHSVVHRDKLWKNMAELLNGSH